MSWLKKLLAIILLVIVIIFICVAIYLAAGGAVASIPLLGAALPELTAGLALSFAGVGLAVAYGVDSKTTSHYVSKVVKAGEDLAKGAASVIGGAIGSGTNALINSAGWIKTAFICLCGYFIIKDITDDSRSKEKIGSQ